MTLCRQTPGLDGVGQDDRGPVGRALPLGEGANQVSEVVAAQVAQGGAYGPVVEVVQQPADLPAGPTSTGQARADLARREA